jgi:hypothetical protein
MKYVFFEVEKYEYDDDANFWGYTGKMRSME